MSATLKVRHEAIGVEVRPAALSPVLRRAIPGDLAQARADQRGLSDEQSESRRTFVVTRA